MSRRRRRDSYLNSLVQRDYSTQSLATLLHALRLSPLRLPTATIEDRRLFHPEGYYRPARGSSRLAVSLKPAKPMSGTAFRFAMPNKVAVCVRRRTRRQVIFALNKAGAGARARARRRNYQSDIGC